MISRAVMVGTGDGDSEWRLGLNVGGDTRIGCGETMGGAEEAGGVAGVKVLGVGDAVVVLVRGEFWRLGMRDGGRIPLGAGVGRPE